MSMVHCCAFMLYFNLFFNKLNHSFLNGEIDGVNTMNRLFESAVWHIVAKKRVACKHKHDANVCH